MKNFKYILLVGFLVMTETALSAQQIKTTIDSLTVCKWHYVSDDDASEDYLIFDNNNETDITIWKDTGEKDVMTNPYYLSDVIPDTFDQTEVGNSKNGRYIITKTKGNDFAVFEIIELSQEKLVLKSLENSIVSTFTAEPLD